MKISIFKNVAMLQLLIGGMAAALCLGILSLILWCIAGGLGAVLIPIVVYFAVRFAEKWRERYREAHNLSSAVFIMTAELPSLVLSGALFLFIVNNTEGGALSDIAGEMIGAVLAIFCWGIVLLVMIGTMICSAVSHFRRRKK